MEALLSIDDQLFMLVNGKMSNGLFDTLLVPLRHKLFWIPMYLALITFFLMYYKKQAWLVLAGIALTISISDTISSQVIKKSVKRIRPCHEISLKPIKRIPCSHGYSFTSSHATNHMGQGMFLFLLFSFWKLRWLFLVWAAVISFAQVYVGVHYPIDVSVGMIIGGLIGFISYQIYNKVDQVFYKNNKV